MNNIGDRMANSKKRKGINGIIVVLFLCVVAVVLCALFKDKIGAFMTEVMTQLQTKATAIIDTTSTTLP